MTLTHERIIEVAARQYGVFCYRQLIEAGGNRWHLKRMIDSGRWETVLPGVYRVSGAPDTWEQRLMAATLWGEPWGAASHRSAARLWGLDGFEKADIVEVTVPYGAHDEAAWALVHRTRRPDERDLTHSSAIQVTRVERTLVDLSAILGEEALEIAMESAFRIGLTSMPRLWRRVDELAGRRGLKQLRSLLRQRQDAPAHSRWEVKLLRLIRAAGLPEPVRQFKVWDGFVEREIDLAYDDRLIGLEYDSHRHHSGRRDWERTHTRFARLTARGWRILPIAMDDVDLRPDETMALVADLLKLV